MARVPKGPSRQRLPGGTRPSLSIIKLETPCNVSRIVKTEPKGCGRIAGRGGGAHGTAYDDDATEFSGIDILPGSGAVGGARLPAAREGAEVARGGRVNPQPPADKGFASVRKVGDGVYATISDISKGLETLSNGGVIVGSEAAMLIEGFRSTAGASFQHAALRQVSAVPVHAALDTHYHFDHTLGNAY